MPNTTDRNRFLKFSGPLPPDKLILHHFSGHEKMGRLFEFHLDLLCEDFIDGSGSRTFDVYDVVGQPALVEMECPNDEVRLYHGYITEFRYVGWQEHFHRFQAVLKPWLWFLGQKANCRIFQEMNVKDIIKKVFEDNGMSDFEDQLTGTYRTWEYCVQYRETDLNFVSRLMEQEGIYYYFSHEQNKHTLVLADALSAHSTISGWQDIPYFPPDENLHREQEHVNEWLAGWEVVTDEVALDDYNFKTPSVDLAAKLKNKPAFGHPAGDRQIYDYPGEYPETNDGNNYARYRLQELQSRVERVRGGGDVQVMASGILFNLTGYVDEEQCKEYLVLSVFHDIQSDIAVTGSQAGGEISYHCQFEAMDSGTQYRSPRITPKPIVQGPQTAVVVGPDGEEIYCDEFGRIKVQFHWDRGESPNQGEVADQDRSCWIRVSTAWAGKNWGSINIPRVGHEVVVSFLEGDPDRPLVTGSVYNAENMPPYTLEENKTQSGIKSRSTKEGDPDNFNEIRFEDEKDKEEFRIQAEKHMNVGVKHVRKTFIGGVLQELDRGGVVADTNPVEGDQSDVCPPIGTMNEQLTVFADREIFIKGNDTLQIAEDPSAETGRCMTVHNGNHELTVNQGDQLTTVETGKKTVEVQDDYSCTVRSGNYTFNVDAGTITMEAATSIELKVGGSSIKIDQSSITLTGTATAELTSSGQTTVKGGMVMIN